MATVPINLAASAYNAASKIGASGGSKASGADATLGNVAGAAVNPAGGNMSFGDLVGEALNSARNTQYKTEALSVGSVANKAQLHELVTAVTDAELTLQTVVSVRDKMISAYQDIVKMPI